VGEDDAGAEEARLLERGDGPAPPLLLHLQHFGACFAAMREDGRLEALRREGAAQPRDGREGLVRARVRGMRPERGRHAAVAAPAPDERLRLLRGLLGLRARDGEVDEGSGLDAVDAGFRRLLREGVGEEVHVREERRAGPDHLEEA
jgi:hypothetical protein